MSNPQYFKARNGAIFNLDDLICIIRQELNQYAIVLRNAPAAPWVDLVDVEEIEKLLKPHVSPADSPLITKLAVAVED